MDGNRNEDAGAFFEPLRNQIARKLWLEHKAGAGHQTKKAHPNAEDERKLERNQNDVAMDQVHQASEDSELCRQTLVAHDDTLGPAGAPRREDDEGCLAQQLS
jgi:hypothetical protein